MAESDGEPPVSRPPLEIPTAEPGDDGFAPRGADTERVIDCLERFGVDETADGQCDWGVFGERCGLSDRTPAEVEAFVASVVAGLQIRPKSYDVTVRRARSILHRRVYLRRLRALLRSPGRLSKYLQDNHWREFPQRFGPKEEISFHLFVLEYGFGRIQEMQRLPKVKKVIGKGLPVVSESAVFKRIERIVDACAPFPEEEPRRDRESESDSDHDVDEEKGGPPLPTKYRVAKEIVEYPIILSKDTSILSLGKIEPRKPRFHTERYLFPIGYRVQRPFIAVDDPTTTEPWFAEIYAVDDAPQFMLKPAASPMQRFAGASPQQAVDPNVVHCLENMKGVQHCAKYRMKNPEITLPVISSKEMELIRRTERQYEEMKRKEEATTERREVSKDANKKSKEMKHRLPE
jgi:hypothetical protein